jgi:formylglycine-generating enzyme required for sulfatase activity
MNDGVTGNYFDYPTSSNNIPDNDVVDPDPGNNATFYGGSGDWTIGPPYYRTEVGEFENSASCYGTFDQGGNVWEWNEAILYGSYCGLRGGSFVSHEITLHAGARYLMPLYYPTSEFDFIGFRVVEVPEPAR